MYTSDQVCALTGCTFRQLDYWARTGHLGAIKTPGVGYARRWTQGELVSTARLRSLYETFPKVNMLLTNSSLPHTLAE